MDGVDSHAAQRRAPVPSTRVTKATTACPAFSAAIARTKRPPPRAGERNGMRRLRRLRSARPTDPAGDPRLRARTPRRADSFVEGEVAVMRIDPRRLLAACALVLVAAAPLAAQPEGWTRPFPGHRVDRQPLRGRNLRSRRLSRDVGRGTLPDQHRRGRLHRDDPREHRVARLPARGRPGAADRCRRTGTTPRPSPRSRRSSGPRCGRRPAMPRCSRTAGSATRTSADACRSRRSRSTASSPRAMCSSWETCGSR